MSGEIFARLLVSTFVVLISLAGWAFPAAAGSPSPDLLPVKSGPILLGEAPSNDDFDNAVVIALDDENKYSYTQNVIDATQADDDPIIVQTLGQAFSSVWYRFTPVQDGFFVLDTRFSNYDTVVSIWAGERGSLALLNYGDNVNVENVQTYFTVSVQAGVTYHIEINNKFEDFTSGSDLRYSGSFKPLLIDAIDPSVVLAGGPGFMLTVTGPAFQNKSIVRWNGADRPTTFVSAAELQAQITAEDIASPGTAEVTVYHPGARYGGSTVPAEVTSPAVTFVIRSVPANDDFINAAEITGASYSFTQDVLFATEEDDDPILPELGIQGYSSVWFRYTPEKNGLLTAGTAGSNYDTFVSIWTGESGSLTLIAYQDDIDADDPTSYVETLVYGGRTYYVEVAHKFDTFPDEWPTLKINGSFQELPIPVIGSINPLFVITGRDGFTLQVFGEDFNEGSVVRWNGADRPTTYMGPTELRAEIPAADVAEAGTVKITVYNLEFGGLESAPVELQIGLRKLFLPLTVR